MIHFFRNKIKTIGNVPGMIIEEKSVTTDRVSNITHYKYNHDEFQSDTFQTIDSSISIPTNYVNWIDFSGYLDPKYISVLGDTLDIHPLTLEDIINSDQRTKMEEYDSYLYIVLRSFEYIEEKNAFESKEIHIMLGEHYVLTFSNTKHKIFNNVLKRIKKSMGRIRGMKADYLAYCLLDAVVDDYFVTLNEVEEVIEGIEEEILTNLNKDTLNKIYELRKELIFFRKSIWSLKEITRDLIKYDSNLIQEETHFFIKDLYDHISQVVDAVEIYRDMLSMSIESYHSMLDHKNNDIMKILTGVATTFIPLTFIAGLYGMNFKYMPGVEAHDGFWLTVFVMVFLSLLTLVYFKIKKWW